MKTGKLFKLELLKNDEYFRSHDTLVCCEVEIEGIVECRELRIEGEKTIYDRTYNKAKVKGDDNLIFIKHSEEYFNSIEDVVLFIEEEYIEIHENEYTIALIDKEARNTVVHIDKPVKHCSLAEGWYNLYTELRKHNMTKERR